MPEITSAETIRAKLREFEERIDGAISAAKTLAQIKADARKLSDTIQINCEESEQLIQKAGDVQIQLDGIQNDWQILQQQVGGSIAESMGVRDRLIADFKAAVQSLETGLVKAEERLHSKNKELLKEQADLLVELKSSTHENVKSVEDAKGRVLELDTELRKLLSNLREDHKKEIDARLLDAEKLLDLQLNEVEREILENFQSANNTLTRTAADNERVLHEQMNSFKERMEENLREHLEVVNRKLVDFLSKQNTLVQNLTHQIDSYGRVTQSLSGELEKMRPHFADSREILELLKELKSNLAGQEQRLAYVESSSQDIKTRLDGMLNKLKGSIFVGSKFR